MVIAAVVPFALIGVTLGLLVARQPLGFVALLGIMSLSGMMIKNAVVLLDEIKSQLQLGMSQYVAIVASAISRLRPVGLAAATTVLGVTPLLKDVFWVAMAVAIMFGLALGSFLTMFGVPVIYACFYGMRKQGGSDQPAAERETGLTEKNMDGLRSIPADLKGAAIQPPVPSNP